MNGPSHLHHPVHLLEHLVAGGLLIDVVTCTMPCCMCECCSNRTCAHEENATSVEWECVRNSPFPRRVGAANLNQTRLGAGLVEEVLPEASPQKTFAPSRANRQGTQESLGLVSSLVLPVLLSQYKLSPSKLRHNGTSFQTAHKVLSLTTRSGLSSCSGASFCGQFRGQMQQAFTGPSARAFAKTPMPAAFKWRPSE